jgi:hypothetical protein
VWAARGAEAWATSEPMVLVFFKGLIDASKGILSKSQADAV